MNPMQEDAKPGGAQKLVAYEIEISIVLDFESVPIDPKDVRET
jgi:hypothetical protein